MKSLRGLKRNPGYPYTDSLAIDATNFAVVIWRHDVDCAAYARSFRFV